MDLGRIFVRNESIVYREEEDGAFLFDPDTGNLKYMNRTAKEAFLLLDGRTDVNQVIQHLSTLYPDVDMQQIQRDALSYLQQLEDADLGSYALSESLYEVAKSGHAAAEGIDALSLALASKSLQANLETLRQRQLIGEFAGDPAAEFGNIVRELERIIATATDAGLIVAQQEEIWRSYFEELGFGKWGFTADPYEMAQMMIAHIDKKRKALGIDKARERVLVSMDDRREMEAA